MTVVSCPICQANLTESQINSHLDSNCNWPSDSNAQENSTVHPFFSPQSRQFSPPMDKKSPQQGIQSIAVKRPIELPLSNHEANKKQATSLERKPLAELARPKTLGDFTGQESLLGQNGILRSLVQQKKLPSLIFWGPPGSGKTTLARILAQESNCFFQELSATSCGIPDVKKASEKASRHLQLTGQKSIIFLDEIHRFSKTQQDFFLAPVEKGEFILVAATTENPSFRVNSALLSRCRVFVLEKHSKEDIVKILMRGLEMIKTSSSQSQDSKVAYSFQAMDDQVVEYIADLADGDARSALNTLELCITSHGRSTITIEHVKQVLQRSHTLYDRNGEQHYNLISALHKSMRGSDDNAALYWLGRMLLGGEDPLYIARRLVRFASEDVGLADNSALSLAMSTYQACQVIGMPECDCILAHCVVYLSRAPKSVESYQAFKIVKQVVQTYPAYPVPLHIRNAPTSLMKDLGYGEGYKYNPDYEEPVNQEYLPNELPLRNFFDPKYNRVGLGEEE